MTTATPATFPSVIFVDSPNTFGKDYSIDVLADTLKDKGYDPVVYSNRIHLEAIRRTRPFEFPSYTPEELDTIVDGHIRGLDDIGTLLKLDQTGKRVVLVNRSFLSALFYNFGYLPGKKKTQWEMQEDDNVYPREACERFAKHLKDVVPGKSYLCILSRYHDIPYPSYGFRYEEDIEAEVELFVKRTTTRSSVYPVTTVNRAFIRAMIASYRNPGIEALRLFDYSGFHHSGDLSGVLAFY